VELGNAGFARQACNGCDGVLISRLEADWSEPIRASWPSRWSATKSVRVVHMKRYPTVIGVAATMIKRSW